MEHKIKVQQNPILFQQQQQQQGQVKTVDNFLIYMDQKLGTGQFGNVYLGSDQTQKDPIQSKVAVKIIPTHQYNLLPQQQQKLIKNEISVMKGVKHENIVGLRHYTYSTNNIYLFLDYCNGGDLKKYLALNNGKLHPTEALKLFKQVINGYNELYNHNIIHRDLKPENIFLHNGICKIGDFGFGRFTPGHHEQTLKMSQLYTPAYASPEMLAGQQYNYKIDIWSLGIILHEMLYGYRPFDNGFFPQQFGLNRNKHLLKQPPNPQVNDQIRNIIQKMLVYDEEQRISWPDLLNHPALQNVQVQPQPPADLQKKKSFANEIQLNQQGIVNQIKQQKQVENKPIQQPSTHVNANEIISQKENIAQNQQKCITPKPQHTHIQVQQQSQQPALPQPQSQAQPQQQIVQANQQRVIKKPNDEVDVNTIAEYIYFHRNMYAFSMNCLQHFLDARTQLKVPTFVEWLINYCLTFYGQSKLSYFLEMLTSQESTHSMINKSILQQFSKIQQYKDVIHLLQQDLTKIKPKIQNDIVQFRNYLQQQITNNNQAAQDSIYIQEFLLKQQHTSEEFKMLFNKYVFPTLKYIFENNTYDKVGLKSIYQLLVFSQIDYYINSRTYKGFDYKSFENEHFTTATEGKLKEMIKAHLSQFP